MKIRFIFALLLILAVVSEISAEDFEHACVSNNKTSQSPKWRNVFNGCHMDQTKYLIPTSIAKQLMEWFPINALLLYCVVVLLSSPSMKVVGSDDVESSEASARFDLFRLQTIFLLFRMAFAWCTSFWLKAAIQQQRPCLCRLENTSIFYILGDGVWGMPSGISTVATIVGMHFIEKVNPFVGIAFPLLLGASRLVLGHNSFGQILAGFGVGLFLHLYLTRTPTVFRFFEVILNLIAGFVTFFVVKNGDPDYDFTFTVNWFNGTAWQMYCMIVLFVLYEWTFLRSILRKSSHYMEVTDFLYYMPLNEMRDRPGRSKHEGLLISVYTAVLFGVLSALKVATPYLDQMFDVKNH